MSGGRNDSLRGFANSSMERSQKMFDLGLPYATAASGMARQAVEGGGEPAYMGKALDRAQANALDSSFLQATAGGGGNALTPETYGSKMARLVAGSESTRANAKVQSVLDSLGFMTGQAGNAGESQTRALSTELGAISAMPSVNPAYSTAMGVLGGVAATYGAGQKAGLWGQSAQLQNLPGSLSHPASVVGASPVNGYGYGGSTLNYMPSYWGR